jgi:hypothetical protein
MEQRGPARATHDALAEVMWRHALRRAREECPDFRFYRDLPSELYGVSEYPSAFEPRLRGVHESYFTWPKRDTFSYTTAEVTPEDVATRLDVYLECEEEQDEPSAGARRGMQWRRVRLTADGRELRDIWDLADDKRPFEKPWPPTAAQVLKARARDAVTVDDGRSAEEWLALHEPEERERLRRLRSMEGREDILAEILDGYRRSAWELYRFLGPELYEGLTAGYRQPLAAALFAAADAEARAVAEKARLMALGRRLRAARTELGLSVEQVVELTGLAKARVQGGERGSGVLKLTDLLALSELYRIPVDQLLAEPEPAEPDAQRHYDA